MLNVLSALCFAGFAALALAAGASAAPARKRRVSLFLLYAVAASLGAGLTQREAWPFSSWPFARGLAGPVAERTRIVAVDETGTEHDVDPRAWEPFVLADLAAWAHFGFPRLDGPARERVARHLLERAEAARARARATGEVGYFRRFLGPLAAPFFNVHPKKWHGSARVPPRPFVGLRLYREKWDLEERARGSDIERVLAYEYAPR